MMRKFHTKCITNLAMTWYSLQLAGRLLQSRSSSLLVDSNEGREVEGVGTSAIGDDGVGGRSNGEAVSVEVTKGFDVVEGAGVFVVFGICETMEAGLLLSSLTGRGG
jgi:hypothetical protein